MSVGSLFADAATERLVPVLPIFLTQSLGAMGSVVGPVDGVAQALRNFVDGFLVQCHCRFDAAHCESDSWETLGQSQP